MKQLKYIIEDKTIAELLGEQNFNNKESAILELVKNSYDANAKNIYLIFDEDFLIIKDDGCGMTEADIINSWMHVGKSYKDYEIEDRDKGMRILAGAKGIGRFALAKLGEQIVLYSCQNGNNCIKWETDWDKSFLTESNYMKNQGTEIIISKLRDLWDDVAIEELCYFLSKTYNDDKMKIYFKYNQVEFEVKRYYNEIIPGKNCLSKIDIDFDGKNVNVKILSDEFLETAQEKVDIYNKISDEPKPINIISYSNNIDVLGEIKTDAQTDKSIKKLTDETLSKLISEVGSFKSELYFVMGKIPSDDMEKFLYKSSDLNEKLSSGVVLYRNAFSISSFEGGKDWLELNKRVRKSPAAPSHESGAWRVRDSQLGGKVEIDKKENSKILELSNRQGVEENIYYKLFKQIICLGLKEFERYRQKIIRAIYKEIRDEKNDKKMVSSFLKKPEQALSYSVEDLKKLAEEIHDLNKETKKLNKSKDEVELKYKYDIRILNSLSTVGLKAASIAHEMQNDRGNLSKNVDLIVNRLKSLNMWTELMSEENTRYSDINIPKMLEDTRKVNQKILSFMKTMLTQIEKSQFNFINLNIRNTLNDIIYQWKNDYSWLEIKLDCLSFEFFLAEDLLKTIFDNLILNSVQQNDNVNKLLIDIKVVKLNDKLVLSYKDSGIGLNEKYKKEPRRILEVHESSRSQGHGLGMWIVNNSIKMCNGSIIEIRGDDGFSFEFTLGNIEGKNGEI